MDYTSIRYELSDHVARITLNRPARLSALNVQMGSIRPSTTRTCARSC